MKAFRGQVAFLCFVYFVAATTSQICSKRFVGGKWKSVGNCENMKDSQKIVSKFHALAETEQAQASANSCRVKSLQNVTVMLPNGTVINRYASMNNNWTVFQRRQDGSVNFRRKWTEYVMGFGDPCREHWLGLEAIRQLTKNGDQKLRIDMVENGTGTHYFAEYSFFIIGPASDKYRLLVVGYSGNASDVLIAPGGQASNHMSFSTYDADNDPTEEINCAGQSGGGWWQNICSYVRLNGKYGGRSFHGLVWQNIDINTLLHLSFVEMKMKKL